MINLERFSYHYLNLKGVCIVQQFVLYFLQDIVPKPYYIDLFGKIIQIPDEKSASALLLIILLSWYSFISFNFRFSFPYFFE